MIDQDKKESVIKIDEEMKSFRDKQDENKIVIEVENYEK